MTVYNISDKITLHHADMRDALKTLPDNSIDSVVCDPPYHLTSIVKRFGGANAAPAQYGTDGAFARASRGFMQQNWDGGDIAFQPATWAEVLRVLKPGGYVAAFGAPRNFGRLQCAIYDAGFEERDTILNIVDPDDAVVQFLESLNEAQLDAFMRCLGQSDMSGFLAWTFGTGFPKSHDVSKGIDRAAGAERKVVGQTRHPDGRPRNLVARDSGVHKGGQRLNGVGLDITAPATDAARQWEGWGTALKPAFEPIVLARKPLSEKTVAANVLKWGTGALNIDGCRVEAPGENVTNHSRGAGAAVSKGIYGNSAAQETHQTVGQALGRWPANVVHDGSDEVVGAFPDSKGQQGDLNATGRARPTKTCLGDMAPPLPHKARNDSGSAARFFYSAKASAKDRNGSKHPTVKPISLMEWLATLITPPGGTILDPFAGSGTTGAAARNKGFSVILCEREAEYVEDIKRRMSAPIVAAAVAAQQPANDNDPAASQLDIFGKAA